MLQLDPRTIYLTGAAFVAIGAVHLLVLAHRLPVEHRRSAKAWALGCFAASTSWVFFALDQLLPDFVTILFGNLTYLLAVVLLHQSVRLFDGLEQRLTLLYSLVAPAIALNLVLKYVIDAFPARVALMSLAVALPLVLAARQLLSGVPKTAQTPGRRMTAGWLIASSVILLVRAAAAPLGASFDLLTHSLVQGILLGASLLSVTALALLRSIDQRASQSGRTGSPDGLAQQESLRGQGAAGDPQRARAEQGTVAAAHRRQPLQADQR